jgi:hypothetical protein
LKNTQHRFPTLGGKSIQRLLMKYMRLSKDLLEFRTAPEWIEPGIANHGRIAKETAVDCAGESQEGGLCLTQVTELAGKVIPTLRIAERSS